MKFIERGVLCICGYATQTGAAHNADDLSALYRDFFDNGKEAALLNLHGSKKGPYCLMWYTQEHETYCYLLGIEAWGEFSFTDISKEGYAPHEQHNLCFEFFPEGAGGEYELWVPVVKCYV